MTQVTVHIPENNYDFFIELVNKLDFVKKVDIKKPTNKKQVLKNIVDGLEEVKLYKKGKLKTTSAKVFLNEL